MYFFSFPFLTSTYGVRSVGLFAACFLFRFALCWWTKTSQREHFYCRLGLCVTLLMSIICHTCSTWLTDEGFQATTWSEYRVGRVSTPLFAKNIPHLSHISSRGKENAKFELETPCCDSSNHSSVIPYKKSFKIFAEWWEIDYCIQVVMLYPTGVRRLNIFRAAMEKNGKQKTWKTCHFSTITLGKSNYIL